MKLSKKYWIFLTSFFGLSIVIALACAGGDWDGTEGSMFTPEIINKPKNTAFFRSQYSPFYNGAYCDDHNIACNDVNVDEWSKYFDGKVTKEALKYWLYKAEPKEVNNMIFTIKGTTKANPVLSEESKKNTLLGVQPTDKTVPFLYYLGFAKRNEKFAVKTFNYWDDTPKEATNDAEAISKQIEGGIKLMGNVKNAFLKERYIFQVTRLFYNNAQFKEAIDFYAQNENLLSKDYSMKWRTLGYVAGSHYKQKDYSKANYLYSLIYDNFEPQKKAVYLSFHPQENADWEKSLAMAKSDREKTVLWQMFGIYADPKRAINEIYKIDPKSDQMDLLLMRLVNIEEEKFTETLMRKPGMTLEDPAINSEPTKTVSLIASQNKTSNPVIWNLAAAYLNYSIKEFSEGDKFLKAAEKQKASNELIEAQYHIISLCGKLHRAKYIDAKLEKDLLPDVKKIFDQKTSGIASLRINFAKQWTRNVLAVLFAGNEEFEKAEMIQPRTIQDRFNNTANIKKMIAYFEDPKHSELEEFFIKEAIYRKGDYQQLLGIRYAQQDKLDSSLIYLKASDTYNTNLLGNPFTIHINDCHDCDHAAVQKIKYTEATFIEKMIEMKNKAKTTKSEAAQNYFLVANGFYNMTYFGNARNFYMNAVSTNDFYYDYDKRGMVPENDCSLALKYYLLAKENSNDKEFKAKCTFMAAKCEQNAWFMNIPKGYVGDFKAGKYLKQLKAEYASTKYYTEVLKECGYFSTYVNQ